MMNEMRKHLDRFNFLKHASIQSKIIISFSVLIVITLSVIGFAAVFKYSQTLEKSTSEYSSQIIEQVIKNINFYINEMESVSAISNHNYYIQKYLKNSDSLSDVERFKDANKITELLDNIINTRQDIVSIFIFGNNGTMLSNNMNSGVNRNYNFAKQNWYQDAMESNGKPVVVSPHKQSYVINSSKMVISLSRSINIYDQKDQLGVILIDLNLKVLDDICRNVKLGNSGYMFIVDSEGNVVYHPDYSYMQRAADDMYIKNVFKADDSLIPDVLEAEGGSFIKKVDSGQMHVTFKKFEPAGWTIIGVTPYKSMMYEIYRIRSFILIIGLLGLLGAFIMSYLISSMISKPVTRLQHLMKQAEGGNLDVSLNFDSRDEIGSLSKSFNNMINKIKDLMHQVVVEQEDKRKTELNALQAQINPHFLYNTLDSIIWMAEMNKDEVVIMADALAKLFRLSLSKGAEIIPVEQEMEHVRNYLIIQSMRYSDKFDYEIKVDENILRNSTLKLILQPLVENSIYHGIKNRRQKGHILIRGRKIEDKMLLEVIDDGIGMEQEKCDEILKHGSTGTRKGFNGVGVKNVNDRIKLYYGDEYGLKYISSPGMGTTAELWLPLL